MARILELSPISVNGITDFLPPRKFSDVSPIESSILSAGSSAIVYNHSLTFLLAERLTRRTATRRSDLPPLIIDLALSGHLAVIRGTQLMHRRDHRAGMVGLHVRVNAVAEIEDVAMTLAVARQHPTDFFSNLFG